MPALRERAFSLLLRWVNITQWCSVHVSISFSCLVPLCHWTMEHWWSDLRCKLTLCALLCMLSVSFWVFHDQLLNSSVWTKSECSLPLATVSSKNFTHAYTDFAETTTKHQVLVRNQNCNFNTCISQIKSCNQYQIHRVCIAQSLYCIFRSLFQKHLRYITDLNRLHQSLTVSDVLIMNGLITARFRWYTWSLGDRGYRYSYSYSFTSSEVSFFLTNKVMW